VIIAQSERRNSAGTTRRTHWTTCTPKQQPKASQQHLGFSESLQHLRRRLPSGPEPRNQRRLQCRTQASLQIFQMLWPKQLRQYLPWVCLARPIPTKPQRALDLQRSALHCWTHHPLPTCSEKAAQLWARAAKASATEAWLPAEAAHRLLTWPLGMPACQPSSRSSCPPKTVRLFPLASDSTSAIGVWHVGAALRCGMRPEVPFRHNQRLFFRPPHCGSPFHSHLRLKSAQSICQLKTPPGKKVYDDTGKTIWEIDGALQTVSPSLHLSDAAEVLQTYCQNLALFGKLFIDHKYVLHDVRFSAATQGELTLCAGRRLSVLRPDLEYALAAPDSGLLLKGARSWLGLGPS
jgi:hypothetical protein